MLQYGKSENYSVQSLEYMQTMLEQPQENWITDFEILSEQIVETKTQQLPIDEILDQFNEIQPDLFTNYNIDPIVIKKNYESEILNGYGKDILNMNPLELSKEILKEDVKGDWLKILGIIRVAMSYSKIPFDKIEQRQQNLGGVRDMPDNQVMITAILMITINNNSNKKKVNMVSQQKSNRQQLLAILAAYYSLFHSEKVDIIVPTEFLSHSIHNTFSVFYKLLGLKSAHYSISIYTDQLDIIYCTMENLKQNLILNAQQNLQVQQATALQQYGQSIPQSLSTIQQVPYYVHKTNSTIPKEPQFVFQNSVFTTQTSQQPYSENRSKQCLLLSEVTELFVSQSQILLDEYEQEVHTLNFIWGIINRKRNNEHQALELIRKEPQYKTLNQSARRYIEEQLFLFLETAKKIQRFLPNKDYRVTNSQIFFWNTLEKSFSLSELDWPGGTQLVQTMLGTYPSPIKLTVYSFCFEGMIQEYSRIAGVGGVGINEQESAELKQLYGIEFIQSVQQERSELVEQDAIIVAGQDE